jgi:SAM-dependent methyltransferase
LPQTGRYLDFGCGNGATLRSAANVFTHWDLFGYEPHVRDPDTILGISGVKGLLNQLDDVEKPFDLITMMHVVEHIPNPASVLRDVVKKLSLGGFLFIQVPYFIDSPYELTVADHCSHFSLQALKRIVHNAGLRIISASSDVLSREITLVATQRVGQVVSPMPVNIDVEKLVTAVSAQVTWLLHIADQARDLARHPFGIFGTAIAGSWLYSHLSEATDFFVDEDGNRADHNFLGRPVYLPSKIPNKAAVYVALIPKIARQIRDRHAALPVIWHLPPDWSRPEIDIR